MPIHFARKPGLVVYLTIGDPDIEVNNREFQDETGPRSPHRFSDVAAYLCASTGKCPARLTIGSVPSHSRRVGNLRFALRETEIARNISPGRHFTAEDRLPMY